MPDARRKPRWSCSWCHAKLARPGMFCKWCGPVIADCYYVEKGEIVLTEKKLAGMRAMCVTVRRGTRLIRK